MRRTRVSNRPATSQLCKHSCTTFASARRCRICRFARKTPTMTFKRCLTDSSSRPWLHAPSWTRVRGKVPALWKSCSFAAGGFFEGLCRPSATSFICCRTLVATRTLSHCCARLPCSDSFLCSTFWAATAFLPRCNFSASSAEYCSERSSIIFSRVTRLAFNRFCASSARSACFCFLARGAHCKRACCLVFFAMCGSLLATSD
mmetsp:Transcript_1912/g.4926  ORF Transcript_1912/g.4926 Transcript_1912/m.4926 type:complete len:203 (-) Transcript_1912:803-1411(-)